MFVFGLFLGRYAGLISAPLAFAVLAGSLKFILPTSLGKSFLLALLVVVFFAAIVLPLALLGTFLYR